MLRTLFLLLSLACTLTACGGGSDSPPNALPTLAITAQPTDISVVAPNTATFTVIATGSGLGYQWQSSTGAGAAFSNIAGATSASFTTAATAQSDTGKQFRVVVSGSGNSIASSAVTLTVTPAAIAPSITMQPSPQRATAPAAASFSVTAAGTALIYQWQRCTDTIENCVTWADISGANAATYSTGATTAAMGGTRFRVKVSNSVGSVASVSVTLSIDPTPVAPTITSQPVNATVTAPNSASFTVAYTGVPTPLPNWQYSNDGVNWFNLGVFDATYNTGPTTVADNGRRFRAMINGMAGSVTSSVATLTVNAAAIAPSFSTQPASVTVTEGQNAQLTVAVSGSPTPALQWQLSTDSGVNWSNINGATNAVFDIIAPSIANNGRQFRAVATNSAGSVNSNAATLTVNAAAQQWQTAAALRGADGFSAQSIRVAAGPNGQFIAAWLDIDAADLNELRTSRYTPGAGWSAPVVVVSGTTFAAPYRPESHAIAMDADGDAVVVFLVRSGVNLRESLFASSQTPTGPWSAPVLLETQEDGRAELPAVAFDGQGVATAVWQQNDTIFFPNSLATRRIVASRLVPGAAWTPPLDIDLATNGNGSSVRIQLKANTAGDVIAAWSTSNNVGQYATGNVYRAGIGWTGAQILTNPVSAANSIAYDVAINDAGNAVVALSAQSAGVRSVFVARNTAGGGWAAPEPVDQSALEADAPAVVLATDGATTLVWQQSNGSSFRNWAARAPANGVWSAPQLISDGGISAGNAQLGMDTAGNVTAVWTRNPGSINTLVSARLATGGSWSAISVIESETSTNSTFVERAFAVSANGQAAAVWVEGASPNAAPWANLFR